MTSAGGATSRNVQGQYEALDLAKKVFEVVDIFAFTLYLVFLLVLWAVAYLTLFAIGALQWYGVYPAMIGIMAALLIVAAIRIRAVVDGLRTLQEWKRRYVAFAFLNVFEFSGRRNVDLAEEVVEKLRKIYPEIDKGIRKNPQAVVFNHTIEGKKGRKYAFDAVIDVQGLAAVVEIRKEGKPVGESEVRRFTEKLSGIINDTDMLIRQAIMVSDGGFTEEAIDYAASKENWVPKMGPGRVSPTLLKVTDTGYQIEWLQAMRQSQSV